MNRVAFRILMHDQAKYLALILGIAFATLLISQQAAIFHSVLHSSAREAHEASQADIWVMKPGVETLDQGYPINEMTVNRVRSVEGVAWAVPYYQSTGQLRTAEGRLKTVQIVGIDEASLVAAPQTMLLGSLDDLRRPDAIILDAAGFSSIFPGTEMRTGDVVEVGERRAVVVGICYIGSSFSGLPRLYARRGLAVGLARETIHPVTYVLARTADGQDPETIAERIGRTTGLQACSRNGFVDQTQEWVLAYSGVAENFGVTILMGIVIGVAIVGQTFYMFSVENLKQFATLKAIGLGNATILRMILTQAAFVAAVGFGIGIGVAGGFFAAFSPQLTGGLRGMFLHPVVLGGTAGFILLITLLACLISVRKVLVVDPAVVFRG
jgi:putative ABC transport system permease protein